MAKSLPPEDAAAIEAAVRTKPDGVTFGQVKEVLQQIPERTLQRYLQQMATSGHLVRRGEGRWTTYHLPERAISPAAAAGSIALSRDGAEVQAYVSQPIGRRRPVGYNRTFLELYRPNVSAYLSEAERARLRDVGMPASSEARQSRVDQPAGTYVRHIMNRLLIDLTWNSSRLEGNTYSLLDTKRLIDFGERADGKGQLEAQMILNHKEAIEFLVEAAEEIGFNRYTILNLHALLASNLLADETAVGRLRFISVGIEQSAFHPLENPALIEECFDQVLATAEAIADPFEQAFFVMVHLPYLQPFDDVNKRVSRLAANIPLIKHNLLPLSFTDVSRELYTQAILGVYEANNVAMLRDVFLWAYERSAARYAAVRQSLGDPDPLRQRYRDALQVIVVEVVRGQMQRQAAVAHIRSRVRATIDAADQPSVQEMVEREVLALHEGNIARYRLRRSEFADWQRVWALPHPSFGRLRFSSVAEDPPEGSAPAA